jgi:TetR/AcrR family transcriptional regulator, transcriptional repressor for nem operon
MRAACGTGTPALAIHQRLGYDDHHMKTAATPRATQSRKEVTHERIVSAAARATRRSGYDGTGVADLMKEVGLTHGGFYAHFASREAMLAEAADRAGYESVSALTQAATAVPPKDALRAMARAYLSKEHVDGVEIGCPVAALGSEMPRQSPKVRRAATRRIKEVIDLFARHSADKGSKRDYEEALVTVSTLVGAVVLARAVDDPKLSETLRTASLKHFDSLFG